MLAATQLGLTEAPVIVLGHTFERGAAGEPIALADNRLSELPKWDEALLSAELQDLLADDYDLFAGRLSPPPTAGVFFGTSCWPIVAEDDG